MRSAATGDADLGLKAAREIAPRRLRRARVRRALGVDLGRSVRVGRSLHAVGERCACTSRFEREGDRTSIRLESSMTLPRASADFQSGAFHVSAVQLLAARAGARVRGVLHASGAGRHARIRADLRGHAAALRRAVRRLRDRDALPRPAGGQRRSEPARDHPPARRSVDRAAAARAQLEREGLRPLGQAARGRHVHDRRHRASARDGAAHARPPARAGRHRVPRAGR